MLFPMMSLCLRGKSCISRSLCASSRDRSNSSPCGHQGLRLARPSGPPPQRRHPPRLEPLPLAGGRGRSFEGSSPPSQGFYSVLSRHWHALQSCGADTWTVMVLRQGYKVPFHHLPPVLLVPQELPSCVQDQLVHRLFSRKFPKRSKKELWNLWTSRVQGSTVGYSWWRR